MTVTKEAQRVNKDDLKKALDEQITDLTPYTEATAAAYTAALNAAQTVYSDPQATQKQVDDALADLMEAKDGLEHKPAVVLGDINGDGHINAADALLALQAATHKITLTPAQAAAADVDGKDGVTAGDALLILQFATQKISSFK